VWGELLAEIYIDTLPAYRHRGYGKAVTTAAVQWVLANTPYVVESVVELVNESSLALMASLHFKAYGYLLVSETPTQVL
jgi:RimJ/RimL family protein N-acetyltransferase